MQYSSRSSELYRDGLPFTFDSCGSSHYVLCPVDLFTLFPSRVQTPNAALTAAHTSSTDLLASIVDRLELVKLLILLVELNHCHCSSTFCWPGCRAGGWPDAIDAMMNTNIQTCNRTVGRTLPDSWFQTEPNAISMATAATSADDSTLYAAVFDAKHRNLKFDLRSGDPQSITVTYPPPHAPCSSREYHGVPQLFVIATSGRVTICLARE
jgi:hypothetical protein